MVPPTHHIRLNMNTIVTRRTRGRSLTGCEKSVVLLWCNIPKKKKNNFHLFRLQMDRFILYYIKRKFDWIFHKLCQMAPQISKPHYYTRRLNWTARKIMLFNQVNYLKKIYWYFWIIQLLVFYTKLHAFMMKYIFWIIHDKQ